MKEKDSINKVIEFINLYSFENNNTQLKLLQNQLNIYESHIELLKNNKIEQHKEEIKKYENKINELYLQIGEILTINERLYKNIEKIHKIYRTSCNNLVQCS